MALIRQQNDVHFLGPFALYITISQHTTTKSFKTCIFDEWSILNIVIFVKAHKSMNMRENSNILLCFYGNILKYIPRPFLYG